MALFDKPMNQAAAGGVKTEKITFSALPDNLDSFKALPQAAMANPFDTAAMTVLALCFFPEDRELSYSMLDFLRGPRPLNGMEKQFIADRFRDKDYVPRSYFEGAVPGNGYAPVKPYSVTVSSNANSYPENGFAKLFISSGGADSPRSVQLRLAKDGRWYLWEQFLLTGIRVPESENPWA